MYVRSFRVFDIQITIAVFTYPGVEFWPGSQKIVLIFYEVNASLLHPESIYFRIASRIRKRELHKPLTKYSIEIAVNSSAPV